MTSPSPCVFDAYGTLFDLSSVVSIGTAFLRDDTASVLALWRQKQLEYTWLRTLMQRHVPFDQVTEDALVFALRAYGRHDPAVVRALMESFARVASFDDVAPVVQSLREAGHPCAILSNGTPAMLASALHASNLSDAFQHVWSAESVQRYKPDPRVYALATDGLEAAPSAIAFVSANAWDRWVRLRLAFVRFG